MVSRIPIKSWFSQKSTCPELLSDMKKLARKGIDQQDLLDLLFLILLKVTLAGSTYQRHGELVRLSPKKSADTSTVACYALKCRAIFLVQLINKI
jgi:hypothetical protein